MALYITRFRLSSTRRSVLASALTLAFLGLFAARAMPASALSLGISWSGNWGYDQTHMEEIGRSGARTFVLPMDPAHPWSFYDEMFGAAWEHGVTILPTLTWSNGATDPFPTSSESRWNTWHSWVKEAVEHYGYNGSFWEGKANATPVTAWQSWNEENLASNNPQLTEAQCKQGGYPIIRQEKVFVNCIQAKRYGEFQVWTSDAIQKGREARSAAAPQILVGALLMPAGLNYNTFLEEASTASGFTGSYQGVGIHPYGLSGGLIEVQSQVNSFRSKLTSIGGAGKSLWITELGWPVGGTEFPFGGHTVSEAEQRNLLVASFNWLKAEAGTLNLQLAAWYNLRDVGGSAWDGYCGLISGTGEFRPVWWALEEEAGVPLWPGPEAVTNPATHTLETQATLNGVVTPNSKTTSYRFEYGLTTAYGKSAPVPEGSVAAGPSPQSVSTTVTGLIAHTHYHFRLVATNAAGTSYGADRTFTTGLKWILHDSNSSTGSNTTFFYGLPGEIKVVGDWDGNGTETAGVYNPETGIWKLRNSNSEGPANITFQYGGSQFIPVVGDWNGDGTTTIGLYEPKAGEWELRNINSEGGPDLTFQYGGSQFKPVTGDWNGDGKTTIGLYEPQAGEWELRNVNSGGGPEVAFQFGGSQFVPVTGDWNGDGKTTIGLFEPQSGQWAMRNANNAGSPEVAFQFGGSQFVPVAGDWDGDGTTTIGLTEEDASSELQWVLHDSNASSGSNTAFFYGLPGEVRVVGDWDGDGTVTPGLYNPETGVWKLRNNNSEGSADITFQYGGSQFKPVVGDWNGDGTTTVGLYEPKAGEWELRNFNRAGGPEVTFQFGGSQYTPITGDWNGDGKTTIGLFEPAGGNWAMRNLNSGGSPEIAFQYGGSQFQPVTGDWNGDGKTTIGLYEPVGGNWALRNVNSGGSPEIAFQFGGSQFFPIAGDWNGDGTDTVGLSTSW